MKNYNDYENWDDYEMDEIWEEKNQHKRRNKSFDDDSITGKKREKKRERSKRELADQFNVMSEE